jgi:hypothetical protein
MAYFNELELESHMGRTFTATSRLTSTQIGYIATEISAMYDGLAQQTEGTETPDEYVKQACLAVASYRIDRIYNNEKSDPLTEIKIIKEFLKKSKTQLFYDQQYAYNTGEW